MCFYISNNFPKRKIATEAITCYKRLEKASCNLDTEDLKVKGLRSNALVSIFQYMQYKVRTTYTSKLISTEGFTGRRVVNVGLHTYSTLSKAVMEKCRNEVIIECRIPKGAKYYHNDWTSEYVSDTLRTIRLL